jgi:hypothetical protein
MDDSRFCVTQGCAPKIYAISHGFCGCQNDLLNVFS